MKFAVLIAISLIAYSDAYRKIWRPRKPKCEPVKCEVPCSEAIDPNGCAICLCVPLCSPPKCEPGCEIQKEFEGPCPGCDCKKKDEDLDINIPLELRCEPLECGFNCREAPGHGDCPICICKPQCSPPKCPPGCTIQEVFDGPCPGCECKEDETVIEEFDIRKPFCDPVKCVGTCREAVSLNGCPTCLCDPVCSPPKCAPGCEVEKEFQGPCPGCVCKKDEPEDEKIPDLAKAQCDPVKCTGSCREIIDENGCPTCHCINIQCMPPKCDEPGCELVRLPNARCVTCSCGSTLGKINSPDECQSTRCLPTCTKVVDSDGCDTCICDPVCDPPKCKAGCRLETLSGEPCPGCVCKEDNIEDEKDKCPPVDDCSKPGCSVRVDPNGCDTCLCRPICDPPRCPRWCKIEQVNGEEQCPTCVCPKKWKF